MFVSPLLCNLLLPFSCLESLKLHLCLPFVYQASLLTTSVHDAENPVAAALKLHQKEITQPEYSLGTRYGTIADRRAVIADVIAGRRSRLTASSIITVEPAQALLL